MRIPTSAVLNLILGLLLASPAFAQDLTLQEEEAIQQIVSGAEPYVVRIETVGGLESAADTGGAGPTSGLILSEDGYIAASGYPFAQLPSAVLVTLPSGDRKPAKVVAHDYSRNLVLLKVETNKPLTKAPAADPASIRTGQWAIAVGRVYSPQRLNVSTGIISATNRIWGRAVQTDAKISPANYGGALLDIRGQVLGVLTPMSPQQQGAAAGAEWYDSGIGFAAPLAEIYVNLDRWKQGDLRPGVLGVAFGKDMYGSPAKVEAVRPKSPAKDAGLQVGDVVIQVGDQPVQRLAQFRHALGPRYAGDTVTMTVERGEPAKRVEVQAALVDKLEPYEHPFLGLLPLRDAGSLRVRWIYPDSPAAKAGLQAGDLITAIDGSPVQSVEDAQQALAASEPPAEIAIEFERDGDMKTLKLTSTALPEAAPQDELPAARTPAATPAPKPVADTGFFEVRIPEESNSCAAYAPANYDSRMPHGLLVILGKPGVEGKTLLEPWQAIADRDRLVLLAPEPSNARGWSPPDVEFVIKTIEAAVQSHTIDSHRIVVLGESAGGAVGQLVIGKRRDLIRGLVSINGTFPRGLSLPENEPLQRLAFYLFADDKPQLAAPTDKLAEALRERKFPAARGTSTDGGLDEDQRDAVARWLDTLDRL